MIRVTRRGTVLSGSNEHLNELRSQFNQQHYLRLPELLEPELLNFIQARIDGGEFYERVHQAIGPNKELCLTGNAASGALFCLMNDERLFQIIQSITECELPRCFEGRVYRAIPNHGHNDAWHDDIGENRLIGLSINLSREVYSGGVLQIRNRDSGEMVAEVANVGAGDAIVFRLARYLEHRITEVKGAISKTAFAGWFRSQPDWVSLFRTQIQTDRNKRSLQSPQALP
jgi:hypothetical protein